MKINLHTLSKELESSILEKKHTILYGDFNVINYLYDNKIIHDKEIILYPDSSAVYFCTKYILGKRLRKHVSTDFQKKLLNILNMSSKNLFFFGDREEILNKLIINIQKQYRSIKIVGHCSGFKYNSTDLVNKINQSKADVLFVGLGVGQQEKWIIENFNNLNVRLILSVGGWFQYLAGNKKRAPKVLRDLHLEWAHKLIIEYDRVWKRYLLGVPKFFYRVITRKIVLELKEFKSFENTDL